MLYNTLLHNYQHLNKRPCLSAGLHAEQLLAKGNVGKELSKAKKQLAIPPSAGAWRIYFSNFLFVILALNAQSETTVTF